ncbi:MBL fold metallo-hydrolase [Photobacterium sp. WH77]|uniref:MBL fold metallo-hydrolase n=1 Tax=unclassified Photobacterium TaxID=2628852 RepID=UPI001EDA5EDA|nr:MULTISPECIES: MBL fold metallo-hydrolase [unclassified Photobacterium]MCG2835367.1 MBL fold metallo-hydrolase [Photobacterium sp. WH77]MCG2842980.1 MBL fold metallo-hydrolase [Photobacterium sp. WH80]
MRICRWALTCAVGIAVGVMIVNNNLSAEMTETAAQSERFYEGTFHNDKHREQPGLMKTLGILTRYITEKRVDVSPSSAVPVQALSRRQLDALSTNAIHVVKLGHSSILLKVKSEYWLLDPVFSERASPFSFLGPKRFHPAPISIDALPPIDKVLISHNHYDHLDKAAIKQLAAKTSQFLVPLGVEGDLKDWGVDEAKILTFGWWQEHQSRDAMIAFTPTQHFSGRGLTDANQTLWGSWVIKTEDTSLYFSGDSGYFDGFKAIGHKYGPFDLTMIETGAYDKDWASVHMTPEESAQAHLDLQGNIMMPIHNGTFDLAFHAWYEPLERIRSVSKERGITLTTPVFGQPMALTQLPVTTAWWREI